MSVYHQNTQRAENAGLYTLSLIELILLSVQFILGMWLSLFAVFPPHTQTTRFGMGFMMNLMFGTPVLAMHMMLGMLISLVSVLVLITSALSGKLQLTVLSLGAMVAILLAGMAGMGFVFSAFSNDLFSFIMAIGSVVAVIAYSIQIGWIFNDARTKVIPGVP